MRNRTRRLCQIAVITAVLCLISPIVIPLPFTPIPISLTTLAIMIAGSLLGALDGTVAVVIYIILGLVGLPVFSGFRSGLVVLAGPTGGFLIGYPLLSFISGFLKKRIKSKKTFISYILSNTVANLLLYIVGCGWYVIYAKVTFGIALMATVVPFLLGDIIKILLASVISLRFLGKGELDGNKTDF